MVTRSIRPTVEAIELAVKALKEQLETDDTSKIKAGIQNVSEASMRLGEAIYKAQQDEADGGDGADEDEGPPGGRRHRRCRFRGPR